MEVLHMKNSRVREVLIKMDENKIPQLIVTSMESIFYLTGKMIHPGERLIALYLDSKGNHKFIVNKLFPINEDLGVEIVWYDDIENPIDKLSNVIIKGVIEKNGLLIHITHQRTQIKSLYLTNIYSINGNTSCSGIIETR